MGTSLATKQDLEIVRRDVENRFALVDEKLLGLGSRIDNLQAQLEDKIDRLRGDMARDLAALDLRMTVKLGSLIAAGFGLTIAALRLWT